MGQCFLLHVDTVFYRIKATVNELSSLPVAAIPYESKSVESNSVLRPNTSLHVASDGSALFLLILEVLGSYLGQEER
jgi:hypothetical protein